MLRCVDGAINHLLKCSAALPPHPRPAQPKLPLLTPTHTRACSPQCVMQCTERHSGGGGGGIVGGGGDMARHECISTRKRIS